MLPQAMKGRELVDDEELVYSQFYGRKVGQLRRYDMENKTKQCCVRSRNWGVSATTGAKPRTTPVDLILSISYEIF